jgi:flagellar FliL protein
MKQAILMAVLVFVAVIAAQVVAPLITRRIYPAPQGSAAPAAPASSTGKASAKGTPPEALPAIYTPLDPPMVATFAAEDGGTRYVQLGLEAMARDQQSIDAIKKHAPALRNAFLLLLSSETYDAISTREGKERLRAQMLEQARGILERNTGKPAIEQLYFTSFVIQ